MPKNSVQEWDTTASNNTDVGGIGIQGTNAVSNFDNGLRTVMSQVATYTRAQSQTVATITDLKAVDTTKFTVAYLKQAGREGKFRWRTGNYSTQIAADTSNGIYVKADAIDATAGCWVRVVQRRAVASWWGAAADGVTNDNTAVSAMATTMGYIAFGPGDHLLTTATFSVPMYFDVGGAITAASGQTITITNRISSKKQHIFKGDGNYRVNIATPNGEDARELHVALFGVFPTNTTNTSQTTKIQKALDAFSGQTREGILHFDGGSYHVSGQHLVPRGVHVKGKGMRRTVFDVTGQGYDVFVTNGEACKFTDFQFEQPSGSVAYRTGALIRLSHNTCEVDRVWLWLSEDGIIVDGDNCSVRVVRGSYNDTMPANTRMVSVRKSGCTVDDVKVASVTSAPEVLVHIGAGAANFGNIRVSNVLSGEASTPVKIVADTADVNNVIVSNIQHVGSGSDIAPALVHTVTSSTFSVRAVAINGLSGGTLTTNLLKVEQGSSGETVGITLDGSAIRGSSGTAITLTQTAGTLKRVFIGDAVDSERATFATRSGTMSEIWLPTKGKVTISNDSTASITPPNTGGICTIVAEGTTDNGALPFVTRSGIVCYDVGSSLDLEKSSAGGSNFVIVVGNVTGTTGAVGNVTVGVQSGVLKIENRSGGTCVFRYSFA